MHSGIAARTFAAVGPSAAAVRATHDVIAAAAYQSVGALLDRGAVAAGGVAARRSTGRGLDESPAARVALAILNGAHGDLVARKAPALALQMTVRVAGQDVSLDPDAMRDAFPDATDRLVVFLHGLTETEGAWCFQAERHHGRRDVNYGTLLRRDLGLTPVFLRYNSGLHVSDNGRILDDLLGALVDAWPVQVQDLVIIGHSMGGLLARSALHQAGGGTETARAWTRLVRDTITLGTPHLGAPLERGVHTLTHRLARLPETRAMSRVLAARSAGIKDLRRGTLVADDWAERDLDAPDRAPHTHVPLHDGARHYVVVATLSSNPSTRSAHLVGDLLVPPRSAIGDTGDDERLAFPADHVHHIGHRHHFHILNDPHVYEQIRRWLVDRPEGAQPAAP
jgi:pimeloyl-ACP methyl ester carboxylesterase